MKKNDDNTTLAELKAAVEKFRDDRCWKKYHTPKDLAVSISVESAELLEKFQWKSCEDVNKLLERPEYKKEIEEELSDVLNYCLALSSALNIDISCALLEKIEKNSKKYPIEKTKGKYKKYSPNIG